MNDLIFTKSKQNRILGLIISIVLIILSIYMIVHFLKLNLILNSIIFIFLLGISIYMLYKNIMNTPTVRVNHIGIKSNVNGMGMIKWELIDGFEIKKAINARVIAVKINDQNTLMNDINKVSKKLMNTNIKKLGSPVVIPKSEFQLPLEIVLDKIESYRSNL